MPLPTSATDGSCAIRWGVGQRDHARRVGRALADADDSAEAALGEGLLVEHRDGDLARRGGGHGLDRVGERLRGEQVGRGVDEVAGVGRGAEPMMAARVDGGLDRLALAQGRHDGDLRAGRGRRGLLGGSLRRRARRHLGGGGVEGVAPGIRTVGDGGERASSAAGSATATVALVATERRAAPAAARSTSAVTSCGGPAEAGERRPAVAATPGTATTRSDLARLALGLRAARTAARCFAAAARQAVAGGQGGA